MQHQNFAEIIRVITATFPALPAQQRPRALDLVRRILSVLGDHALSAELDRSMTALSEALSAPSAADASSSADADAAAAVETARRTLGRSVGQLNSRATRVPPA
jgi:hypothetical protein